MVTLNPMDLGGVFGVKGDVQLGFGELRRILEWNMIFNNDLVSWG